MTRQRAVMNEEDTVFIFMKGRLLMNILLLMMGGSGIRFGAEIPKQYVLVEERPVFSYIMKGYDCCDCVDRMIVVTHPDWVEYVEQWRSKLGISKLYSIVPGGSTRSESVKNGLISASEFAQPEDVVLIHDATHPYVDETGTMQVIEAVKTWGGATLGEGQFDTMYQMDADTRMLAQVVPREQIVSGASPEAFRFGDIYRIYMDSSPEEMSRMTSAGAIALHHGIRMQVIPSNVINLKITYQNDMDVVRQLVHLYFDRYF